MRWTGLRHNLAPVSLSLSRSCFLSHTLLVQSSKWKEEYRVWRERPTDRCKLCHASLWGFLFIVDVLLFKYKLIHPPLYWNCIHIHTHKDRLECWSNSVLVISVFKGQTNNVAKIWNSPKLFKRNSYFTLTHSWSYFIFFIYILIYISVSFSEQYKKKTWAVTSHFLLVISFLCSWMSVCMCSPSQLWGESVQIQRIYLLFCLLPLDGNKSTWLLLKFSSSVSVDLQAHSHWLSPTVLVSCTLCG